MTASAEMPRYQCHKKVWALKIAKVEGTTITPVESFAPIDCDPKMFARFAPAPGDYYVVYEGDGYAAFSPAKAFEDGYAPIS